MGADRLDEEMLRKREKWDMNDIKNTLTAQ